MYTLRIKAGARGCNPRVKSHPATCAVDAEQSKVSSIRGTFDWFLKKRIPEKSLDFLGEGEAFKL